MNLQFIDSRRNNANKLREILALSTVWCTLPVCFCECIHLGRNDLWSCYSRVWNQAYVLDDFLKQDTTFTSIACWNTHFNEQRCYLNTISTGTNRNSI